MRRFSENQYRQRTFWAMTVYVACMLLIWPLARDVTNLALKLPLALAPVLPMLYVMALMAKRILHSDELEQRTHLIGLGMATAVAAIVALIGGFLALAKFLSLESASTLLIWIFPLQMVSYGFTRWWVARRYGDEAFCTSNNDDRGLPIYLRLMILAVAAGFAALWSSAYPDEFRTSVLTGMACGSAALGGFFGILHWRVRRDGKAE
jgi:hypothetical protein